jgi:hypothetical protein
MLYDEDLVSSIPVLLLVEVENMEGSIRRED